MIRATETPIMGFISLSKSYSHYLENVGPAERTRTPWLVHVRIRLRFVRDVEVDGEVGRKFVGETGMGISALRSTVSESSTRRRQRHFSAIEMACLIIRVLCTPEPTGAAAQWHVITRMRSQGPRRTNAPEYRWLSSAFLRGTRRCFGSGSFGDGMANWPA